MKYPAIPKDERKNQKLTVAQHEEIDYAVNTQRLGILFLAKKYKVNRSTIMYWSNPMFKAVDKMNSTASRKRLMKNPVTRKKILLQMKNNIAERRISQPLFDQWMKSKKHTKKHINSVSYADNICHSKKETRSTKSFKTLDVSPTQSTLPMVRKLYISLLSILRKISQPIHALRKGSLITHK